MPLNAEQVQTAGTPEWWMVHLAKKLHGEKGQLDSLNNYDVGDHVLPTGHARARQTYQRFQRQSRTNFVGLITDAVMDRLKIDGFRMGAEPNEEADSLAQRIWQGNGMDAAIRPVLRDALAMRRAYISVGPDPDPPEGNGSGVLLTGEDPRQVIHSWDPTNRRRVRAALKMWTDDADGQDHAVLYLPDTVHYYVGPRRVTNDGDSLEELDPAHHANRWTVDDSEFAQGQATNPSKPFVPIVPLVNRPEKNRMGFGEFEDVIAIQDRINQGILDRLIIAAAQSFRQRWATGVVFKDERGNDVQPFDPGADLMWHVEAKDAEFGDFSITDLRPLIEGIKSDIEQLASISRTAPYYLLGELVNISGDALTAADTGATAKAEARQLQFGEALEQMMSIAFQVLDRTASPDIETIWADAERRNEAKAADAAVKKKSVGVPWRQIMEDLGYSPAQIERMKADRAEDNLRAMLAQANLAAQAVEQQQQVGQTEEGDEGPPGGPVQQQIPALGG